MDAIKLPLVLLIFGGLMFFLFTNRDTTAKVDVQAAEVLAQIAQQDAEMAATRNGGKPVPQLVARAEALRDRATKIAEEAQAQKANRDGALEWMEDWFRDHLRGEK